MYENIIKPEVAMDLVGKMIILRKFRISDLDFLYQLNNDPLVNRYLSYRSMDKEI